MLGPLLLCGQAAFAQLDVDSLDLDHGHLINDLVPVVTTIKNLSPTEVFTAIDKDEIEVASDPMTPGYSEHFFWVLIELRTESERELILEIANAQIDFFSLYFQSPGGFSELYAGGDHTVFGTRPIAYRNFSMPLNLEEGPNLFLLKLDKRKSPIWFPLKLWTPDAFESHTRTEGIYHGVFFGLVIVVFLVSLILSILFKSILYFSHSIYTLLVGFYIFCTQGYAFQYLYPDLHIINDYIRLILLILNSGVAAVFFSRFINARKYCPASLPIARIILLLIFVPLLLWILFPVWARHHGVFFTQMIMFLYQSIFVLFAGTALYIYLYKEEKVNSLVLFVASLFPIIGFLFYILMGFGVVDLSLFPIGPMALGLGIEIIVLAVSMVARLKGAIEMSHSVVEAGPETIIDDSSGLDITDVRILYVKSEKHYMEFILQGNEEPISMRKSIKEILNVPGCYLVQTHRSYLVNPIHVRAKYATKLLMDNGVEVPISRSYKSALDEVLIKI